MRSPAMAVAGDGYIPMDCCCFSAHARAPSFPVTPWGAVGGRPTSLIFCIVASTKFGVNVVCNDLTFYAKRKG